MPLELTTSNICSLFIIGGLSVLAVFHVLMYFMGGGRKAHWVGFACDVCMILLMSFAGPYSVWGNLALQNLGENLSRTLSFLILSSFFYSFEYQHAAMSKFLKKNKWFFSAMALVFLSITFLFSILDLDYYHTLRQVFYVANFVMLGYIGYHLLMAYRKGDDNSLWLVLSFALVMIFFTMAVIYDFKNHTKSWMDYLALFLLMITLDINLILRTGFKISNHAKKMELSKSELNKQIEDLQTSNQCKDQFLSIISHDLKNPISSIKLLSDIYLEEAHEQKSTQKIDLAEALSDSIDNLYKLLDNLLTWTRTQNGTITCQPAELQISDIVEHLKYSVESICNSKNIDLNINIKGVPTIYADRNMTQTILRNLITNAVKFSHPDSIIEVVFDSAPSSYIIKVIDHGVGMTEKVLSNLFRIDKISSTCGTRHERGTGLGLILCKEFAEKQNGTIQVSSKVGEGTTFTVTLPKQSTKNGERFTTSSAKKNEK